MEQDQRDNSLPIFTKEELAEYTGGEKHNGKIYFGCKGVVFDVSESDFYKEGSAYHVFAGNEASVGLAKVSKEAEYMNTSKYNWKTCLDEKEQKTLEEWYQKFKGKYPVVGYIDS